MRKNFLFCVAGSASLLIFQGIATPVISTMAAKDGVATLPSAADIIPNGTHFLVRLDRELRTSKDKVNKKFDAKTLEPLETSTGYILAPGTKVRGHISRIERGGLTSRAGLWLTFDDIDTRDGRLPIVAEVSSVPGDFSVRPGENKEGEIEARTKKTAQDLEAAAGAALGAAAGASAHGGTGAAIGGATGGIAGFVGSSRSGQELDLPKDTKLDLVLDRPLYLPQ
jgi:hypothetical protein